MNIIHSSEKGQILVLLALVLLGLLGFTALAIDGGMIYADRRYMQSAADATSLAGAGEIGANIEALSMKSAEWSCADLTSAINAGYSTAINKADANGFTIAPDASLGSGGSVNGVNIICDNGTKSVDVMVMLTRETNTSFVHLFNGEPMKNTVTSITTVLPGVSAGGATRSSRCAPGLALQMMSG